MVTRGADQESSPEVGGYLDLPERVVLVDVRPAAGDETGRMARVHVTDHGPADADGPSVLLLHGNPTWAYLYRDVIRELGGERRCLAPDYPGFGRSPRPRGYGCTPPEHADCVRGMVESLDPGPLVVVGHDWGGPIGLALAASMPGRIAGLVLCNSWCWRPDLRMWLFSLLMGGRWPGRWLQLQRNLFVRRLLPLGILRQERRSHSALEPYRAPFPTPASRLGTWVFPRAIRTESDWVQGVAARIGPHVDVPVRLVWGMADPAFGREAYLRRWRKLFPDLRVDRVPDASHYVPEDRPDRIVRAVRELAALGD